MCANLFLLHTAERNRHEFDFVGVVNCAAKNVAIFEFEHAVIGVVAPQVRVYRFGHHRDVAHTGDIPRHNHQPR